ncbi:MAG: hypothetical protein ACFCU1_04445 [Sumerlaeia bacterium]
MMFQQNPLRTMKAPAAALALMMIVPTPTYAGIEDYFVDRFHDVLDIVRLRSGIPDEGEGYGVKARVTSAAQVGYVNFDGTYAGINRRGIGMTREDREEGGISFLYFSEHAMDTKFGNVFLEGTTDWSKVRDRRLERNKPYWDDGQGDPLGIGAEIATPILALDIGIYPIEIADFVLGIFTIDIMEDDRITQARNPYLEMFPTQPPVPNLTIAAEKKNQELIARRQNITGYDESAVNSIQVSTQASPVQQPAPTIVLDSTPPNTNPEIGTLPDSPTDQQGLNAVLEASNPVAEETASDTLPTTPAPRTDAQAQDRSNQQAVEPVVELEN